MGCHGMSWDVMGCHGRSPVAPGRRRTAAAEKRTVTAVTAATGGWTATATGIGGIGAIATGIEKIGREGQRKTMKTGKMKDIKVPIKMIKMIKIIKMIKKTPQDQIRKHQKVPGFDEVTPWWQVRQVSVVALAQRGSHGSYRCYRSILSKTPLRGSHQLHLRRLQNLQLIGEKRQMRQNMGETWEKRPNKHIKHGYTLWFRTKNVVKEVEASWKHTVLQKNAA